MSEKYTCTRCKSECKSHHYCENCDIPPGQLHQENAKLKAEQNYNYFREIETAVLKHYPIDLEYDNLVQVIEWLNKQVIEWQNERIESLEERLKKAVELIDAKDELLVCYRIGKRPTEKLFAKLKTLKEALEEK